MEVVISIAAKIVEYTVEPVGRWLCYSFRYDSNIENLKNRVKELQGARDRVKHDVDAARRNAEEIETDVNNWLEKVGEIIQKAKVPENEDNGKLRFANGGCLNLKQRHQLSREAKKLLQAIDDLKISEDRKFERVGHRPRSEGIMTGTAESYLSFPSRQSTVVELMEALKDTNIHMIGVGGMGGIGNTMLVTDVSSQVVGEKLFFEKAMADVGQSPNIIQGEIADMIRLKLEGETEVGRAEHLAQRLIKDTKTLVVLDNIWKTLDLKKIGIPCKGCKVILVSKNQDVLRQIGIQKDFGLVALPKEEAWNLAVKMVDNSIEGSEFQEIATKLVKKCDSLLVALEVVFKALKDKSIEEWKEALQRWKDTF